MLNPNPVQYGLAYLLLSLTLFSKVPNNYNHKLTEKTLLGQHTQYRS